ncbi:MAG TPA: CBS domain-containing protein, partial [Acidimicrobiales bacterium]|nr:CBS domain-containing protein [Acidimicrobiales bacterium]
MPTIREVMTPDPIALDAAATIQDAARVMRQYDVGDVLVTEGNQLCGVLTDRDIAVRAAAEGRDPQGTPIGAICTFGELEVVAPSDPVEVAVERMRTYAVR